jgi:hypothetical protein
VQGYLSFPVQPACELPRSPLNFAVRNTKPDQIGVQGHFFRGPPGMNLPRERPAPPTGIAAFFGYDFADAISSATQR